jgi:hypothetical protein
MNEPAKKLFYAIGMMLALTHFGYAQTNSTNAGTASLVVTNYHPTEVTGITTLDGTTYRSVRILKVEPDGLLIEYMPQAGGIGLKKLKFENLSTELQLKYGYDAQKAAEYQTAQATGEAKLRKEMQVQQEQTWAAERARAEDNFLARQEIDRQAAAAREAARVQAERDRAARIKAEAERYNEVYSVGSGSRRGAGRGTGR